MLRPEHSWRYTGKWCHISSPPLPLSCYSDLTGAQDGSVRMFEWGHSQQIICFRSPGNSRVTRIRFNHQGNKVTPAHMWTEGLNSEVRLFLALQQDSARWFEVVRFSKFSHLLSRLLPFRHEPAARRRLQHTLFSSQMIQPPWTQSFAPS